MDIWEPLLLNFNKPLFGLSIVFSHAIGYTTHFKQWTCEYFKLNVPSWQLKYVTIILEFNVFYQFRKPSTMKNIHKRAIWPEQNEYNLDFRSKITDFWFKVNGQWHIRMGPQISAIFVLGILIDSVKAVPPKKKMQTKNEN